MVDNFNEPHMAYMINIYKNVLAYSENGETEKLKYIINDKEFTSYFTAFKNSDGYTPLILACKNNHIEIVKLLIDTKGCDSLIIKKNKLFFNNVDMTIFKQQTNIKHFIIFF